MASGDTKTNQYLDIAANGTRADLPTDTCCETRSQTLIRKVAERIMDVEEEVERLENNPDVADIVATYADLQSYDTSQLTDKDVIRVLQDETHDGDSTYYRWSTATNTWTYIGESKQYTDFVGTDGTTAGTAGLVPAPATTDAGKFLKADGTWDTAGSSVNVVQTTGTSTTDVMSQNAVTSMIFADPANRQKIQIGRFSDVTGDSGVGLGDNVIVRPTGGVAIGAGAVVPTGKTGAIALGAYSGGSNLAAGEMNIGSTAQGYGYNSSSYRLLTGLYDPQSAHDAANKEYVDTAVAGAGANTISSQDWSDLWQ